MAANGSQALVTFSRPVTVSGSIALSMTVDTDGGPETPQGIYDLTSSTLLTVDFDDPLTVGGAWSLTSIAGLATTNGGTFTLPASGTIGAG